MFLSLVLKDQLIVFVGIFGIIGKDMCVLVVVRLLVMVIDWLVLLMNLKGGKFSNDSVVVSVLFVWKIKFVKGNCFLSWGICMVELVKFICLF